MKAITKKQFKQLHEAGELQLIASVSKTKEEVLKAIEAVKDKIEQYTKPVSNYGDISTSKDGYITTEVYISDCENFIFVESIIDNSKCNTCSWNTKEVNTVAYLSC